MENKTNILFTLILVVLIVGMVFYYFEYTKTPSYVQEYEDKIEDLHAKIDSLHSENKTLDTEVESLTDVIAKLDVEIYELDETIKKLRKDRDENINNVDSLSINELTEFFTNRYGLIISNSSRTDSSSSN